MNNCQKCGGSVMQFSPTDRRVVSGEAVAGVWTCPKCSHSIKDTVDDLKKAAVDWLLVTAADPESANYAGWQEERARQEAGLFALLEQSFRLGVEAAAREVDAEAKFLEDADLNWDDYSISGVVEHCADRIRKLLEKKA